MQVCDLAAIAGSFTSMSQPQLGSQLGAQRSWLRHDVVPASGSQSLVCQGIWHGRGMAGMGSPPRPRS
jgi:hypothetical protein